MHDRIFFDSNLLVYLATEPSKASVISMIAEENRGAVGSIQTLNEFANVCFKRRFLDASGITTAIGAYLQFLELWPLSAEITLKAVRLKSRYGFQFYDGLILATALDADCTILYSEDLQHGQRIDGTLTIVNPFAP